MKVTKEQQAEALKLANDRKFKALWINENGEFFTDPSYAAMSVKYDKERYTKVDLGAKVEKTEVKTTTDLDKVADVIAKIEAAETGDAVEAILKAEREGKNRKPVIAACSKKLDAFMNAKVESEKPDDFAEKTAGDAEKLNHVLEQAAETSKNSEQ